MTNNNSQTTPVVSKGEIVLYQPNDTIRLEVRMEDGYGMADSGTDGRVVLSKRTHYNLSHRRDLQNRRT